MDVILKDIDQLDSAAERILQYLGNTRIVLLKGDLGAGKTTLVKAFCRIIGSADEVTSPTFALVNVYMADGPVYHIDLYRLETLEEALQIGIEDYMDGSSWCFVEWPELIEPVVRGEHSVISIEEDTSGQRKIHILKYSS